MKKPRLSAFVMRPTTPHNSRGGNLAAAGFVDGRIRKAPEPKPQGESKAEALRGDPLKRAKTHTHVKDWVEFVESRSFDPTWLDPESKR